jgi:hypothetical protein
MFLSIYSGFHSKYLMMGIILGSSDRFQNRKYIFTDITITVPFWKNNYGDLNSIVLEWIEPSQYFIF